MSMGSRSVLPLVPVFLLALSCVPSPLVQNHVGHPVIAPPHGKRPWQLGIFFGPNETPTRYGPDVRLFHEMSCAYAQLSFGSVGVQFEATDWFVFPGAYLTLEDERLGTCLKILSPTGIHVPKVLLNGELSVFHRSGPVEVFAGFRAGKMPIYVYARGHRPLWDDVDATEGFAGIQLMVSHGFGVFTAYSQGRYANGFRTLVPEDLPEVTLKETSHGFSQVQSGFTFRF